MIAPAPTDSCVAQQQQTRAERGDGIGETVHHEGLHGVEERRAEVLLEDDADDARPAAAQRCGARVGPGVAERCGGCRARVIAWRPTPGVLPLKTTDAVDGETPASRATSEMVARRVLMSQ